MNKIPSQEQLAVFDRTTSQQPVVLFHQYDGASCKAALTQLAGQHGGRLIWAGAQEQALIGAVGEYEHACQFQFRQRSDARAFACDAEHARVLLGASAVQVAVLSMQPRAIAFMSNLLARVLPYLPFNNAVDPTEEPGVGTSSTMPSAAGIAQLKSHPQQDTPVVMINWLKFRERANYPAGIAPASGRTAYLRYGKVAMQATHSLGAKLICASRYQQILIGYHGDPATALWDEFALMQYPGRATFTLMASLQRYRRVLPHREAGLAENGQGLAITKPDSEFTWHR